MKVSADNLFLEKFIHYTNLGYSIEDTLYNINRDGLSFNVVRIIEGEPQTVTLNTFPSYYVGDVKQYLN